LLGVLFLIVLILLLISFAFQYPLFFLILLLPPVSSILTKISISIPPLSFSFPLLLSFSFTLPPSSFIFQSVSIPLLFFCFLPLSFPFTFAPFVFLFLAFLAPSFSRFLSSVPIPYVFPNPSSACQTSKGFPKLSASMEDSPHPRICSLEFFPKYELCRLSWSLMNPIYGWRASLIESVQMGSFLLSC